jgi:hypothetical protein
MKAVRNLSLFVLMLGIVGIIVGAVFLGLGAARNAELKGAMQQEQITLGIEGAELGEGEVIDSAREAQIAGDTVREHRHGIAPTYGDLLGDEKYDPTNPLQLTYAQALNLENYLYLAVAAFGLVQVVLGAGAFMIIAGFGLLGTGLALYQLNKHIVS